MVSIVHSEPELSAMRMRESRHEQGSHCMNPEIYVHGLDAWFGEKQALHGISMEIPERQTTAIIGPSGCGKSTFVRCLNRMHETVPEARVRGSVKIGGVDVYGSDLSPVAVRRRVGMVFQKPNPFPTMTIYDNVAAGLKLNGYRNRGDCGKIGRAHV